jgi:hypothetical protein
MESLEVVDEAVGGIPKTNTWVCGQRHMHFNAVTVIRFPRLLLSLFSFEILSILSHRKSVSYDRGYVKITYMYMYI